MDYNSKILEADFMEDGRESLPRHDSRKWSHRDPEKIIGVCFHQSLDDYGRAKGNARYHMNPNHISKAGLPGLSYTIFVEKSGKAILANSVEDKTYSQGQSDRPGDENALYLGVCFGGNFSGPGYDGPQEPTQDQIITGERLWNHLEGIWGWGGDAIHGHFDFGKPACPGYVLMDLVKRLRPTRFGSVIEKQRLLAKVGFYNGSMDGVWGPASKLALVKFQKSYGLVQDGVWGQKTTMAARVAIHG